MTDVRETAALIGGIGLLERAVNYTLGSLHLVTPDALASPTPCRDWDLRALLEHLDHSLLALFEAVDVGAVALDLPTAHGDFHGDPVAGVRDRACLLVGAWANAGGRQDTVTIAGSALTTSVVTSAGALEVAVHGWDVARACGRPRPIPPALAEEMLDLSPLLVTGADRPARFAAPAPPAPAASPSDRLLAFLGRHPDRTAQLRLRDP